MGKPIINAGLAQDTSIRHDLRAGDLGRVIALHGKCYDALPGFGVTFEAFVARTLAEYVLDAGGNGRIWLAEQNGRLVGCTAIVLRDGGLGQLRWVLVHPGARGAGLGKELVQRALAFCRKNDCTRIFLETTDGLPESQTLYESLGFEVVSDRPEKLWDGIRPLIRMELEP
jgi:GNAT superfamily N-acetyltransferase